jgi:CheY-like chemotaxis protein
MAILNLAVNARDAMPQGGALEIRTQTTPAQATGGTEDLAYPFGFVDLVVQDTGTGIPENLHDKIFDPFFTTKQHAGTGLGLSQVYGFARQSGGNASVQSVLGEGTAIKLRFPLAAQQATTSEVDADAGSSYSAKVQAEILVVEDDIGVRRSMIECLQVLGFRVREASDGAAGLVELKKARPDLLLVDYLMPHMNGAELIAHAQLMYVDLPILMATGFADMNAVEKLIGPQSVLAKPFDLDTLGKAVSAELRRNSLRLC